jgi:hypothetical protein
LDVSDEESPAAGAHKYVYGPVPPLAVGLPPILVPTKLHEGIVLSAPASAVGLGFTVIVVLAVAEHVFVSVTVTV